MTNWEEFWEKICGSFCTANEARKCAENFAQFFAQFFAQTSARVIKICRRNFALGKVRRKPFPPSASASVFYRRFFFFGGGGSCQEDVNSEKLTVKKWWIFGADFFTVYADFSRFVRDINGEKKNISLLMIFFTVSFSRFAPSRSWESLHKTITTTIFCVQLSQFEFPHAYPLFLHPASAAKLTFEATWKMPNFRISFFEKKCQPLQAEKTTAVISAAPLHKTVAA